MLTRKYRYQGPQIMELPSATSLQQEINTVFSIKSNAKISMLLSEVNLSSTSDTNDFENISLIFLTIEALDQGIYTLSHESLGLLELFLVPVGKQQENYQYEALINRKTQ